VPITALACLSRIRSASALSRPGWPTTTWRPRPSSPTGLGRSLIVDPEGLVRLQAGDGEELLTDVLDLDAVTRVRESGTAGVPRLWEQAKRSLEPPFPLG